MRSFRETGCNVVEYRIPCLSLHRFKRAISSRYEPDEEDQQVQWSITKKDQGHEPTVFRLVRKYWKNFNAPTANISLHWRRRTEDHWHTERQRDVSGSASGVDRKHKFGDIWLSTHFAARQGVEVLSWNHCTSTPHRSETNGIAERAVRRVKEGTSAVLSQSGLNESWWGRFYGMLHLSGKRHRSIVWWEDALWKTFWATI